MRVRIYGLLEARLQSIDRVVLGGLVEGVWPPETRSDPWLSRPMRRSLGLDLPERRILAFGARTTSRRCSAPARSCSAYPAKLSGAPTVSSRFLQRLAAVAGEKRWDAARERGERYLTWARELDRPAAVPKPVPRPEPKPARDARPTSLSVTDIETWLRDPYSIYARHILKLQPLDAIDTPPGARDRGTVIHGAIGRFTSDFKDALPNDAIGELIKLGEEEFAVLEDFPEARAFWWPRFLRIARWFADFETRRRLNLTGISAEIGAKLEIPLGHRAFTLRTRACDQHRAPARRQLRDPRLQDRPAADHAAGIKRSHATTDARRRDPARREIRRNSGRRIDRGSALRLAARRRSRRRVETDRLRRQHA